MLDWLKKLFGMEAEKHKEVAMTQKGKKEIPDRYKKQVGIKDGQIQSLRKELTEKDEIIDKLKEEVEETKKERERERKQRTKEKPYVDKENISVGDLMTYINSGGKIDVVSKEHRPLGKLYDFKLIPVGDKMTWHIITEQDGEEYDIIDGFELMNLIHRPDGLVDLLDSGMMVVNRTYDSRTPIPDAFVMDHGDEKHIESWMQEKRQELNQMYGKLKKSKKSEQEERDRRKMERLDKEMQKSRADSMASEVLSSVKDMTDNFKKIREIYEDKEELSSKETRLTGEVKSMQKTMGKVFDRLEEQGDKKEVQKAREDIMEELKALKKIQEGKPEEEGEEIEEI